MTLDSKVQFCNKQQRIVRLFIRPTVHSIEALYLYEKTQNSPRTRVFSSSHVTINSVTKVHNYLSARSVCNLVSRMITHPAKIHSFKVEYIINTSFNDTLGRFSEIISDYIQTTFQ